VTTRLSCAGLHVVGTTTKSFHTSCDRVLAEPNPCRQRSSYRRISFARRRLSRQSGTRLSIIRQAAMLRPATPLTIVLLISFVLLLLSTLSSPIIPSIPIATFKGVHFGVFGYCQPDHGCTNVRVGYTTGLLPSPRSSSQANNIQMVSLHLKMTQSSIYRRTLVDPFLHFSSFTLLPLF
jgi:hypothetical protein